MSRQRPVRIRRPLAITLAALVFVVPSGAPEAQDVVEMLLADARRVEIAQRAAEADLTTIQARPLRFYPQTDWALLRIEARETRKQFVADSIARAQQDSLEAASRTLVALDWVKTEPSDQDAFLNEYRETYWRAASALLASPVDTMQTLDLRTRLTQLFGTPTRNAAAAAQERYAGSEFVQFEYWFVVNDSIPMLVLDTAGPFGRGLLIAGRESQASLMPILKADLDERLLAAPPTVPFVDYYHDYERKQWFKTGFDGDAYFTHRIRTPRWARNFVGTKWLIHR